jgi:hypothetical protein
MYDPVNGGFGQAPKFPHPAVLDLLIDQYSRSGDDRLRDVFVRTLEKMARGGVYDQLAGGFHRYSVDERWIVPHFEKMCYDNSELLKNYVHAYQATGSGFLAGIARDIIRWMDEWLSDRERGGFYASQDADCSMDDDGDYFTWTLAEAEQALSEDEAKVACLYYDINETGEMHHNAAKNVLYARASMEEIAQRLAIAPERAKEMLERAKTKMYSARLQRPAPYVDKTVYVGWNALCISAYLQAARVLDLAAARGFALRSLDRILTGGWQAERGLAHVLAYSDPEAEHRYVAGVLDDYACTFVACLDAYEATGDLSYFRFARQIAERMNKSFFDTTSGGFFDSVPSEGRSLGVLGTPRKPFQDSPTPAGNSVAAMALMRLHAYTGEASYREKAEQTMEFFAGVAGRYGIFAGTYGIAAVAFSSPHTQVFIFGDDEIAAALLSRAVAVYGINLSVLRMAHGQVVAQNLPPALAQTLPNLPALKQGKSFATICSNFACQSPMFDPDELTAALASACRRA